MLDVDRRRGVRGSGLNVRLFANWQITENISLFGRIENLLGDDYQEARRFPALGSGAYAGVKVKF